VINFKRYSHVNELIKYYIQVMERKDIKNLVSNGIKTLEEAELFSKFIWDMVQHINDDEASGAIVLGSNDNTEILPDISYEVTKYMRDTGFYSVWAKISNEEIE